MTRLFKRHQPVPKIAIIGLSFSIVVAIVGAVFVIFIYHALTADDRTRLYLESGISLMPVPPGCSERVRRYQKGDLDAVSTYSFNYQCDTSGAAAHDAIVGKLKSQGFTVIDDHSLPTPGSKAAFYSFSYKSQNYAVSYRFLPDTSINLETQSIDQLHNTKVSEIGASLTRLY